jgi:hypothetical protein
MKSLIRIFALVLFSLFLLNSCEKEEETAQKLIAKLGAQSNATFGAFYSIDRNKTYKQDAAFTVQDTINLLCFYEHDEINNRINDITLASPGANITGIFTGESSVENWTVKNLTTFTLPATAITPAEFDLLEQNDAIIESYYDNTVVSGNKKAKLLKVDDIYAFKTHDNIYGLFKVTDVVQGAEGYVEIELKLKK